jgi:hypothetical protein
MLAPVVDIACFNFSTEQPAPGLIRIRLWSAEISPSRQLEVA